MVQDNPLKFAFASTVTRDDAIPDGYMKHYIPIPDDIGEELASAGVTHLEGDVEGHTFRRSLQQREDGTRCLMFGMTWLKQAKLEVDMQVVVELFPDPDPDRVNVPEELAAALSENPHLEHVWESLAPSRRKMLGYHIERAKRPETRKRRVQGILDELGGTIDTDKA